jgi:broad specificity phosphatase PhoE
VRIYQLADVSFTKLYHSPLKRASRTAEIVWGERTGPVEDLASLREVDLYSLQGLMKVCAVSLHLHAPVDSRLGATHQPRARAPTAQDEGMARFGDRFRRWQKSPNDFEIDGHFPVRCGKDVCYNRHEDHVSCQAWRRN